MGIRQRDLRISTGILLSTSHKQMSCGKEFNDSKETVVLLTVHNTDRTCKHSVEDFKFYFKLMDGNHSNSVFFEQIPYLKLQGIRTLHDNSL